MGCFRNMAGPLGSTFFDVAVLGGDSSLKACRSMIVFVGLLIVLLATPPSVLAQVPIAHRLADHATPDGLLGFGVDQVHHEIAGLLVDDVTADQSDVPAVQVDVVAPYRHLHLRVGHGDDHQIRAGLRCLAQPLGLQLPIDRQIRSSNVHRPWQRSPASCWWARCCSSIRWRHHQKPCLW